MVYPSKKRRALRDSSAATISNGPLAAAAGASLLIPSTAVRGSLDDPLDLQGIGPARQSQPSPRVAGAQALATAGAEINKIRIFARHSGEAILLYVAEAPLTSPRHDLGRLAAPSKGTTGDAKIIQSLTEQL